MALPYEDKVLVNRSTFIEKVKAISSRLGILPEWLMIVMAGETSFTFRPDIRSGNEPNGAVGLIQFTGDTAKGLGTSKDALAKMSNVAQLDYVEAHFKPHKGRMKSIGDVYIVVFAPAYLGKSNTTKVYLKPSSSYTNNASLDVEKKGYITIGDIKNRVNKWIPSSYQSPPKTLPQNTGITKTGIPKNWVWLSVGLSLLAMLIFAISRPKGNLELSNVSTK